MCLRSYGRREDETVLLGCAPYPQYIDDEPCSINGNDSFCYCDTDLCNAYNGEDMLTDDKEME